MTRTSPDPEERAIYVVAVLALAPVLVAALWTHGRFGTGETLALLGVAAAACALARRARRAPLPPARLRARGPARRGPRAHPVARAR